jgi:hypothetical protein
MRELGWDNQKSSVNKIDNRASLPVEDNNQTKPALSYRDSTVYIMQILEQDQTLEMTSNFARDLGRPNIATRATLATVRMEVFERILHHLGGSHDPALTHKTGLLATGSLAFFLRH